MSTRTTDLYAVANNCFPRYSTHMLNFLRSSHSDNAVLVSLCRFHQPISRELGFVVDGPGSMDSSRSRNSAQKKNVREKKQIIMTWLQIRRMSDDEAEDQRSSQRVSTRIPAIRSLAKSSYPGRAFPTCLGRPGMCSEPCIERNLGENEERLTTTGDLGTSRKKEAINKHELAHKPQLRSPLARLPHAGLVNEAIRRRRRESRGLQSSRLLS